jgi:hypothetical protein
VRCYAAVRARHPESFPQTQNRRGLGGRRDDLNGLYVRSRWEANWARYLNWLQSHGQIKQWKYEPHTFEFAKIKRGTRFYTPDFWVLNVNDSQEYHEVKGYMDQRSATKLSRMARYFPHVKIVLIEKVQYRAVAQQMSGLIATWEASA